MKTEYSANKSNSRFPLLLALMIGLSVDPSRGAIVSVTVERLYDNDGNPHNSWISNGANSLVARSVTPFALFREWDEWEKVGEDTTTEPPTDIYDWVHYTEMIPGTDETTYTFEVPDTWVGYTVSCTWNFGAGWTSFTPLVSTESAFTFTDYGTDEDGGLEGAGSRTATSILENTLVVGKWTTSENAVLTMGAWDNSNPDWPAIGLDMTASTPNAFWRWLHPSDDGQRAELAMDIDHLHRLTVRKRNTLSTSPHKITLDPEAGEIRVGSSLVITANNALGSLPWFVSDNELNARQFISKIGGRVGLGSGSVMRPVYASGPEVGQVVLGKYNDANKTSGVLIVGNGEGTGVNQRSNGLRILDDGTVLIKKSGDVEMGLFQNGERP